MSVSHCSNYSETGSLARDGPLLKHLSDTTLLDPDPKTQPKPFPYPFTFLFFWKILSYVPLSFKSQMQFELGYPKPLDEYLVLLAEEKHLPLLYHIILNYYIFIGLHGIFFP